MRKWLSLLLIVSIVTISVPAAAQQTGSGSGLQVYVSPEFLVQGLQAANEGNHQRAALSYSLFILLNPSAAGAYFERARSYLELGDTASALADFERVIALGFADPQLTAVAYLNRANVFVELQAYDEALADLEQAARLNPALAETYLLQALVYREQDRLEDALTALAEAINRQPNFTTAYQVRIAINRQLGNTNAVQADIDRLTQLAAANSTVTTTPPATQEDINTLMQQAVANDQQGNLEAAIRGYSRVLELNPESADTLFRRGIAYARLNNLPLAVEDFTQIITLFPDEPLAYYFRGLLNVDLGKAQEALIDFDRTIELDPQNMDVLVSRGRVYIIEGRLQEAVNDFTRAIEINPAAYGIYLYRGYTYNALNDNINAAKDYLEWLKRIQTRTIDQERLSAGESRDLEIAQGWVHHIPFQATAGQILNIEAVASSVQLDPLLVILDRDGVPLIANDDNGVSSDSAILNFILPADGMYTIIVSHAGGGSNGSVQVRLGLLNP